MSLSRFRRSVAGAKLRAERLYFDHVSGNSVVVFMYHSVSEYDHGDFGPWAYAVSPSEFESQVSRIAEQYEVVGLDELISDPPTNGDSLALITFDDGYSDTLTEALPVLDKYDVPATVYVSTSFVEGHPPYEHVVANAVRTSDFIDITVADERIRVEFDSLSERRRTYSKLKAAGASSVEIRAQLLDQLPTDGIGVSMLSSNELDTLGADPLISIGAHGHQHLPLRSLPESEVRVEVERSTDRLADLLGQRPDHFSYPYGSNDGKVRAVVKEAGYSTAVATTPGRFFLDDLGSVRHSIPRIDAAVYGVV